MDLRPEDIQPIYGDTFFIVADDATEEGNAEVAAVEPEKVEPVKAEPIKEEKSEPVAVQEPAAEPSLSPTGNITWRTKEASQVLFILHQNEIRDKELGELLKKIVASIGIPFEQAGFGIVKGEVNLADFQQLPNPYGVVFDLALRPAGTENPMVVDAGTLFFCDKLDEMKDNNDMKRELWNYLKGLKEKLN